VYLVIDQRWGPRIAVLIVSALGLGFACVSTLVFIGSMLAGFPIWAPPGFVMNWRAFQSARLGKGAGTGMPWRRFWGRGRVHI
jgi:hypothetical protein